MTQKYKLIAFLVISALLGKTLNSLFVYLTFYQ